MKKFFRIFLFIFLSGLLSVSYAKETDLYFETDQYINQTGNGYNFYNVREYAIDVISPGKYYIDFHAVNSWKWPKTDATKKEKEEIAKRNNENASSPKFDVLLDGKVIISNVVCPSTNGNAAYFGREVNLPVGKHRFSIRSKENTWWMKDFSFKLLSTERLSGYTQLPGNIGINRNLNPGNSEKKYIYANKSGKYKMTFYGKLPGIAETDTYDKDTGDILRVLIDNKEIGTFVNVYPDAKSFSGNAQIPEGNHVIELYDNGGHFYLSNINFSLEKEEEIKPIVSITKEELERKPTDFEYKYSNNEEGMSIDDAKNNINGFLGKLVDFFAGIFTKLLTPIMNLFLAILQKFLTDENGIIRTLFDMAIDIVTMFIRMWLFEFLVLLLRMIDALTIIFNIFAGTKAIVISGQSKILFNYIFENSAIQRIFWGIFLVGIALNIIIAIITITKASFTDDKEKSVGATVKEIARGALSYIMVPIFVVASVNLASVVLKKTDDIISVSTSDAQLSFGNTLFMAFSMGEETTEYKDCKDNPSFTDRARIGFYNDNTKYQTSSNSGKIFDFAYTKLIMSIAISIFIILMLTLSIIMFITRIFDLILLFIISPYFAASIPLDGGQKFKKWRMTFIAKLVSGFGLVIMMKIFVAVILPIILGGKVILSASWIVDIGLKLLFITGGMYAVFKSHNLLMQIINPQMAMAEMGIAEVGVQAAKEVSNLVISEAKAQAGGGDGGSGGGSAGGGLSDQQKTLAAMK